MSSTIESLKISASSKKPELEYIDIMGKVGKTTSLSELPKNYNQAYYARNFEKKKFESVSNTGEDLLQAVYKCKKSGEKFVREVQSASERILSFHLTYKSKMLYDFMPCHQGVSRSVFCRPDIQTDFYVTVILFRNPILINKEGTHSSYFPHTKYFRHTNYF